MASLSSFVLFFNSVFPFSSLNLISCQTQKVGFRTPLRLIAFVSNIYIRSNVYRPEAYTTTVKLMKRGPHTLMRLSFRSRVYYMYYYSKTCDMRTWTHVEPIFESQQID